MDWKPTALLWRSATHSVPPLHSPIQVANSPGSRVQIVSAHKTRARPTQPLPQWGQLPNQRPVQGRLRPTNPPTPPLALGLGAAPHDHLSAAGIRRAPRHQQQSPHPHGRGVPKERTPVRGVPLGVAGLLDTWPVGIHLSTVWHTPALDWMNSLSHTHCDVVLEWPVDRCWR